MSDAVSSGGPLWRQKLEIRSYDVDFQKLATMETLCRLFLDAAWNHADALGVGFHALAARGQLWVLSQMRIEVSRYPAWGSHVTLLTWPRAAKSVFAMRDFRLLDAEGAVLAAGASAWLVLDMHTRKPQRLERLIAEIGATSTDRALTREPTKIPALPVQQPGLNVRARYSDIDVNEHVNSARYVGWAMDSYPLEWHRRYHLASLEVNYLAETHDGETLAIGCDLSLPEGHLFSLVSLKTSAEACRMRLGWRGKNAT